MNSKSVFNTNRLVTKRLLVKVLKVTRQTEEEREDDDGDDL